MSTTQWTLLGIGLGLLALGASSLRWSEAWKRWGVEGRFGIRGSGALLCLFGMLLLIGIAAGLGSFTLCILGSSGGLGEMSGIALWVGIAAWGLAEGVVKHDPRPLKYAAFMWSLVGLAALFIWLFHREHEAVKPITDFCGCF